jgi:3-oxoadipate CoA-transferase beta subunit
MAARVARDIPRRVRESRHRPADLVADFLPKGREIILHSENGILGVGPEAGPGMEDEDLMNAGKEPVTLLTGGAYFHHADSFAMIRGRHLDFAILGAFQVSVAGDLANWHTGGADAIPAVGGAMDLAVGAKKVW